MAKQFIRASEYQERWRREVTIAAEVYERMSEDGARPGFLLPLDFHFVSNDPEKLVRLEHFIESHYPYSLEGYEPVGGP